MRKYRISILTVIVLVISMMFSQIAFAQAAEPAPEDTEIVEESQGESAGEAAGESEGESAGESAGESEGESEGESGGESQGDSAGDSIDYSGTSFLPDENGVYDFSDQVQTEREEKQLVPQAADIPVSVQDEKGASGVVLVAYPQLESSEDFYLNAFVAGNSLLFTSEDTIKEASSSKSGAIEIQDNTVSVIPAEILAAEPEDEIITITMEDGSSYRIHTYNALLPDFEITGSGVAEENAGVYSFILDGFMIRVSTDGKLVYYRDTACTGAEVDNFAPQMVNGKEYFTIFLTLHKYTMSMHGMFLLMDENYQDADTFILLENQDTEIPHQAGYLEPHEFLVLGEGHYITLCYFPMLVSNLPEDVEGINGTKTAYVWAGLMQEIKDGQVLNEINTANYPVIYSNTVERTDFAGSVDTALSLIKDESGRTTSMMGLMDYTHINSIDYILDTEGNLSKLLVSMRMQSAVYQFDVKTGEIDWILGGKGSTLTGYEDYTTVRKDENGVEFSALTFGQHYAKYTNKNEDGTLDGDPVISIFDNQTGERPFTTTAAVPTLTRTMKVTINEADQTAVVSDVIEGVKLNELSDKYHIGSHCGLVDYFNDNSVVIGWGFHILIDEVGPDGAYGTVSDEGYPDLRAGSRPVVTEYDPANNEITFELSAVRNPDIVPPATAFFSYRTYKTEK